MAKITRDNANSILRQVCDEFAPQFLTKCQAAKQSYDTAKTAITSSGGTFKDITETNLSSHGYTKSQSEAVKTYLEGCVRTLSNREIPTGFQLVGDICLNEDGKGMNPHYLEYALNIYLKPNSGESGNTYSASINLYSCSGDDKYYLNSNPGDSTGETKNDITTDNNPISAVKGQISALLGGSSDADSSSVDTSTFVEPTFTNDADRQKNKELAAQYPERVVNGIYYADDTKLAQAKAAYEAKTKSDALEGSAKGGSDAQKLVSAMKAVNTTLYECGENARDFSRGMNRRTL